MKQNKIPLTRAILILILTTVFISGSAGIVMIIYNKVNLSKKIKDNHYIETVFYNIDGDIPIDYILKVLGLSKQYGVKKINYSIKAVENILSHNPMFKDCKIFFQKHNQLYFESVLRKPIALVDDFHNAAIDDEGVIFPVFAIDTIENNIKVHFDIDETGFCWGGKISKKEFYLFLQVCNYFHTEPFWHNEEIYIDFSQSFCSNLGEREIVVEFEKNGVANVLRLLPDEFFSGMENFLLLTKNSFSNANKKCIFDLRFAGFILCHFNDNEY